MTDFLDGLLVLDLARGVAGAYSAKLMADAGATVVKIESAQDPDPLRPSERPGGAAVERAALFAHLNTSKRSAEIDVTTEAGREQTLALAAGADAVVEDRRPGALDALGLGFEALRAANPALVLTSITPFGQTGPYRDYRANDLISYAMGGRMSANGIAPRPPVRLAEETPSYMAGAVAAGATLSAIWSALDDGDGDHVDVSIVECLLGSPDRSLTMWEFGRVDVPRLASPRPLQTFPCADGFVAIALNRGIERLAKAIGQPELTDDPRFATNQLRQLHSGELEAVIAMWTITQTKREVFDHLQRNRVISAPVNTVADLSDDPQFLHRGAFVEVESGGRRLRLPGRPLRVVGEAPVQLAPPPAFGAHTEEMLDAAAAKLPVGGGNGRAGTERADGGRRLPLEGLRVIDFGDAWAGPYACTLLADAGAEVIRIEDIHRMPANMRGPRVPAAPFQGFAGRDPGERPWERFFLYNACERNKQGITLDLKQARGRELFLQLVEQSDVVVTNYAHGGLGTLGLEYDDLRAVNPELIFLLISGYGADGPYANFVALGTTIDAASGHQSLNGYPETAPAETAQGYYADASTACVGFFSVVAALHHQRRTGEALNIELALSEVMFAHLGGPIAAYSATGEERAITGNRDRYSAPQGVYPTAALPAEPDTDRRVDDRWIAIACRDDEEWRSLLGVMDPDGLALDERFGTTEGRLANHDALDELIGAWTVGQEARELMHRLQAAGVPASAVMPDSDIYEDAHVAARSYLREIDHEHAGTFRGPGPIWRSTKHDLGVRRPANGLGEHNHEILQGRLGVTDEEFAALEAAGVCGERYSL